MKPPSCDVTALLRAWGEGDRGALDALMPLVYAELRRQAERYMRAEAQGHTLQATALVHEAYLRMVDQPRVEWQHRAHFFALAANAMRRILVDRARARRAAKRGGAERALTLSDAEAVANEESNVDVLVLHEALTRLAELDPRQARVVELRYFGGLSIPEAAEALGVAHATVERDWRNARLWLRHELGAAEAAERKR